MSNFRHIKVTQHLSGMTMVLEENRFVQVPEGMTEEQEEDYIFDKVHEEDIIEHIDWEKFYASNPRIQELDFWDVDTDWEYIDKKDTQS